MKSQNAQHINVAILALDEAPATTITGPHDVFALTGVIWNMINHEPPGCPFHVEIISPDGNPVSCYNDITILPHRPMLDSNPDLILVSAVMDIEQTVIRELAVVEWLKKQHEQGALLGGICTGTMLIAETGLLNNKIATTHWGMIDLFRKRYPKVILKEDELITDAGDIFCSGAFNSFLDLSIYLVEKLCGRKTAIQCSKALIHDLGRSSQAPYTVFLQRHDHSDATISDIQTILEKQFKAHIDFNELARDKGMGRRTFERRFKKATGRTPLLYLQQVRVERAKLLLESGRESFNEISYTVGYEDPNFFRRLFVKHTSLLPSQYRSRFSHPTLKK